MSTGIDTEEIITTTDPRFLDDLIKTFPGSVSEYRIKLRHSCFAQPEPTEDDSEYLSACAGANVSPYSHIEFRINSHGLWEPVLNSIKSTRERNQETFLLDKQELANAIQEGKMFYELKFGNDPRDPAHYGAFRDDRYPKLQELGYVPWRVSITKMSDDGNAWAWGIPYRDHQRWQGRITIQDRKGRNESLEMLRWSKKIEQRYHNR